MVHSDWVRGEVQVVKEFNEGRKKDIKVYQIHLKEASGRTVKERLPGGGGEGL